MRRELQVPEPKAEVVAPKGLAGAAVVLAPNIDGVEEAPNMPPVVGAGAPNMPPVVVEGWPKVDVVLAPNDGAVVEAPKPKPPVEGAGCPKAGVEPKPVEGAVAPKAG